ncbi:DUF4279 domain-containing protein [Bacillus sp. MUM 116]|uniref:DUF4279 domain-containing protein n=1 Tax=Bacillus sp. MUM 116 TaxID=1678002 RepID=UPI0035284D43
MEKTFQIDYVTELLGIKPTNSYKKGDIIVRNRRPNVEKAKSAKNDAFNGR